MQRDINNKSCTGIYGTSLSQTSVLVMILFYFQGTLVETLREVRPTLFCAVPR